MATSLRHCVCSDPDTALPPSRFAVPVIVPAPPLYNGKVQQAPSPFERLCLEVEFDVEIRYPSTGISYCAVTTNLRKRDVRNQVVAAFKELQRSPSDGTDALLPDCVQLMSIYFKHCSLGAVDCESRSQASQPTIYDDDPCDESLTTALRYELRQLLVSGSLCNWARSSSGELQEWDDDVPCNGLEGLRERLQRVAAATVVAAIVGEL